MLYEEDMKILKLENNLLKEEIEKIKMLAKES